MVASVWIEGGSDVPKLRLHTPSLGEEENMRMEKRRKKKGSEVKHAFTHLLSPLYVGYYILIVPVSTSKESQKFSVFQ